MAAASSPTHPSSHALASLAPEQVAALNDLVAPVIAQATELRHWFHQHPELGFAVELTAAKVVETLVGAGLPEENITTLATTFKMVDIAGTGPEAEGGRRCVALRADMDGLPIVEATGAAYASTHAGGMHACGHDGHMAALLAFALVLLDDANGVRAAIPSNYTVRLFFQPAEERPGGAEPAVAEGCLEGVNCGVYGFHNWPTAPLGDVRVCRGPLMAHVSELDITIIGRGGHGSQPQACVDPVLTAAKVVDALHTIVSRNLNATQTGVISVCSIHGGEAYNVIPDTVTLKATIRDFDPAVFAVIESRIHTVVNATCEAYGARAEIDLRSLYPAVVNHDAEADLVATVGASILGPDAVSATGLPTMAAEDFSYYIEDLPGCFFFLGGGRSADGTDPGLHTDTFDFNDGILPIAAKMFLAIVRAALNVPDMF